MIDRCRRRGPIWTRWLPVLVLAVCSMPVEARLSVLTVMVEQHPAHEEVVAALRARLGDALGRRIALRTVSGDEFARGNVRGLTKLPYDLILTLGAETARTVLHANPAEPVLCGLLPSAVYLAAVPAGGQAGKRSALFLDQPYTRQIRLARLALPALTGLGVVLGPEGRHDEASIRRAAGDLAVHIERISDERQIVSALHRVMDVSEALLVVPDAQVFTQHTAQSVLLTAYRRGLPVFAYSRAYVTAGALAAVHTTPAQTGQQLADILLAYEASPDRRLPAPSYSRLFEVEVNERVAHSLGIEMRGSAELTHLLSGTENPEESP